MYERFTDRALNKIKTLIPQSPSLSWDVQSTTAMVADPEKQLDVARQVISEFGPRVAGGMLQAEYQLYECALSILSAYLTNKVMVGITVAPKSNKE